MSRHTGDDMGPAAQALLRHARAPRPRSAAERARTTADVRRIAAAPVAIGVWLGWKGGLLAMALSVGAVGAMLHARRATVSATAPTAPRPRRAPVTATVPHAPAPTIVSPPVAPVVPVVPVVPAAPVVPAVPAPSMATRPAARPVRAPVATVVREPDVEAVTPAPSIVAPSIPRALAPTGAVSSPSPPDEDEQHVLERARSLLGSDPAESLRLTERGDVTPRGGFAEERELIAMEALQRLSRRTLLHERAAGFLQRFPRSLYAERVRRWLAAP